MKCWEKFLSHDLSLELLIFHRGGIVYHWVMLWNCGNTEQSRDLYNYKLQFKKSLKFKHKNKNHHHAEHGIEDHRALQQIKKKPWKCL